MSEYKEVRIGPKTVEIPVNWITTNIGNIGKIITGTTPSTKDEENFGCDYPFVTPEDMGSKKIITSANRGLSVQGFENARQLPENSIMFVCIGATIGKIAIAGKKLATNQQINSIICDKNINSNCIYYILQQITPMIKSQAGNTATPIINKGEFSEFSLPLPPLPEQRRIAEILSTVDDAIQKTDQIIEKAERLKKGLMQDLLTKGIGHTEFKEVQIGPKTVEIPNQWKLVKIKDIATNFVSGGTPSTNNDEYWGGDIPWTTNAYVRGPIFYEGKKYITEEGLKKGSSNIVPHFPHPPSKK